jgi:integrase
LAIFKKGNDWYIDYYVNGRRRREKIGPNRKLAETVLSKRKVAIAEGKFLDIPSQLRVRFDDFSAEYLEFSKINKRSWTRDQVSIKSLKSTFGGKYLSQITPLMIEHYKAKRKDEVMPASVNRELACLKHMFTKAIEWGKTAENPAKKVKLLRENNQRLRYLTSPEAELLIDVAAPHLKPILVIALNTGMRKGEILNLKWEDIDFKRRIIFVKDTKNSQWGELPMNATLTRALTSIERRSDSPYVFSGKAGKPFTNVRKSFDSALRRAGIENFRFHDLRHTFASNLVMAGVDLTTVKELLGHKTIEMTMRYSHLSRSHKSEAVERLEKSDGHLYGHQPQISRRDAYLSP